ncbi:F-box family protein [Thalictrum thalictroides]|uniref:F-box family protein n=1 Tax=Thalictrum thalictroides TaxID=46969 RepID=A0A7J6VHN5_THATH|nr:F-box family protein [Thalictrum thalictroides]
MKKVAKRSNSSRRDKKEDRPWSDLLQDLMENIMKRLFYADHVRLRLACKGWRSMYRVPPIRQLPWLMALNENAWTSCKLFDPVYKKTYNININDDDTGLLLQGKSLKDISIQECKNGWFFMSESNNPMGNLFLYSPFINGRIITLPNLNTTIQIATFSSVPTDSDCVFFTLNTQTSFGIISISTCCLNDGNWYTRCFESTIVFGHWNVICLEGVFYCSNIEGKLGSYSIASKNWTEQQVETETISNWLLNFGIRKNLIVHMVEVDGEICKIYTIEGYGLTLFVYKLDRLKMKWNYTKCLGDHVIFLGGSDVSFPASVEGRILNRKVQIRDRIYRCVGTSTTSYDVRTARTYTCIKSYPLSKEECYKIWLEPPQSGTH